MRKMFDIPAQPLVSALNAYATAAHLELFYDGSLAVGRVSSAVHGILSPSAALQELLRGTDFVARLSDSDTMTIEAAPGPADMQLAEVKSRSVGYSAYLATIQASLRDAFCHSPTTRTGAEDVLVRLWIAPSGMVSRAELLSSTGAGQRDAAYTAALLSLDVGVPPPPAMPQPVTMMILPRSSPEAAGCAAMEASAD